MADNISVHSDIDTYVKAKCLLANIPVVFGNIDDTDLTNGKISFIKERVYFKTDNQHELGNVSSRRVDGVVVIIIHVRKGAGDADRESIYNAVVKSLRSQIIGAATFLNPLAVAASNIEHWNLTGWNVPFYYYES